jgi:isoleucyl-tRNA synthetase
MDRHMLHAFGRLVAEVVRAYGRHQFHRATYLLHQFCTVDLSAFYLDVLKDRLYVLPADDSARRSAQTVLLEIGAGLVKLLAPIIPFTADEIWEHFPAFPGKEESVHLGTFTEPGELGEEDPAEARRWESLLKLRDEVLKALEKARAEKLVGTSLEARVWVAPSAASRSLVEEALPQLAELLIVSQVEIGEGGEVAHEGDGVRVGVGRAAGDKCGRCWNYTTDVGTDESHPELCRRCVGIVTEMQGG